MWKGHANIGQTNSVRYLDTNAIKKNAIKKLCDKLSMKKSQSGNGSSCFKLSSVGNPLYFKEPLKNFTMNKTPKDTKSGIAPKKIASFQ